MKQNLTAKIVASIWLFAIAMSIIWTWVIVFFSNTQTQAPNLTQEELNELLKNYSSWSVNNTWSLNQTWVLNPTQSWTNLEWTWNNNN